MPLTDRRAGRDADDDVREVLAARTPEPEPAELDRRVEAAIACRAIRASSSGERSMSTSTFRLPSRIAAATTRPETKSAAIESPAGEPEGGGDEAGEHRDRAREVAAEVERVREERVAAVEPRAAQRDHRPRRVDDEHERDRRERPPRRLDLELDDASQAKDRRDGDADADEDQEPGLRERGEVLRLAVSPRMPAVGRRTATETAKNVRSAAARSVPECAASASSPRLELARPATSLIATRRHRGPDRDERGAPLRRHGAKATAARAARAVACRATVGPPASSPADGAARWRVRVARGTGCRRVAPARARSPRTAT